MGMIGPGGVDVAPFIGINGIEYNMIMDGGKEVWKSIVDQTVLNGLLLWCSGTKSSKTNSRWDDISGNNRHISLSNATVSDSGYAFNGINTLGTIPLNLNIWNSGASCIVIAKYTTVKNYSGVVGDHYSTGASGYIGGQYQSGSIYFGFHPPTTGTQLFTLAFNNSNFTNGTTEFNEIATIYDRNILSVYINGVLKQSKTIGQISTVSANMVLGRAFNLSDRYLNGNVRDVKFYNRALSGAEVLQNYNQNKSEGLVN